MNMTNDPPHEQAVEPQPRDERTTALSLVTPVSTRVGYAAGAGVTAEVLFNVMNAGPSASFVIASLAAGAAWYFSPEIRGVLQRYLPFVKIPNVLGDVTWRDVLSGRESREDEQVHEEGDNEPELGNTVDGTIEDRALDEEDEDETAFVRDVPASATSPSGVQRFTIEQFVSHTERNSYKAFIGRSLTQERNPALAISFYKRHIKIIGASQKGKSSMAAAFLDTVARTHDSERVMVALLDMEDQTSKLFTDLPHLACMTLQNGETVLLHARTPEQVLEYLGYIVDLMNYRYTLSKADVAQEPLFIVYLEEFLALKDHFKLKIDQAKDKEAAKRDYAQLVYCIKEIARRGLKVLVQFLMCAQVDYRDDDLQEALINVTSGICFCVRATAASAAGFMQTELLNRNAKENKPGQGVAEMPDCKDLILAPEYNLEKLLIAWEKMQPVQEYQQETGKKVSPIAPAGTDRTTEASDLIYRPATPIYTEGGNVNAKTPIYTPANTSVNGSTSGLEAQTQHGHLHLPVNVEGRDFERKEGEGAPVNVNVNEETRAMIKRLNEMKNELKLTHGAIAKAVKLNGRDYPIYKAVCKEMGIATEKEA